MTHDIGGTALDAGDTSFVDAAPEADAAFAPDAQMPVPLPIPPETCNGIDDDGDLKLDEGCSLPLARGLTSSTGVIEFEVDSGRVAWSSGNVPMIHTTRLPQIDIQEVVHAPYGSFALDDDRVVVNGSGAVKGYTIVDLETRAETFVPVFKQVSYALQRASLEGKYLAYAQSFDAKCGDWCDETEVYLHDLDAGHTQVVAPHARTIQTGPKLTEGRIVWWDDRYGHHLDGGVGHWGDAMVAALPYVASSFERLTEVQPLSVSGMLAAGGRLLVNVPPARGLDDWRLLDLASHDALPLALVQGDTPISMDSEHLLLLREPLGRCHLALMRLEDQASLTLDTQGVCPSWAEIDGDFVVWSIVEGQTTDLFWMDIGDLTW